MRIIIGGAHQGQLDWAKSHYNEINWIDGSTCQMNDVFLCDGIFDFHIYIRRFMECGEDTETLAKRIIENNPNIYIVSDEIGYGLVPVDAFERHYREQTGRICTELAAFSEAVIRVVMGIGQVIKNNKII